MCFSALASTPHELLAPRGGGQLDVEQPPEPAAHVAVAEEPRKPVHLHRRGRTLVSGSAHCGEKSGTWGVPSTEYTTGTQDGRCPIQDKPTRVP